MDIFRISKLDSIFEIKAGPEAEILRTEMERPENLLWRDTPGDSMAHLIPATNEAPASAPSAEERRQEIERLSRDALEHLRQLDYPKVIEIYRQLLQLDPNDVSAMNNLGVVYEKRPEWKREATQTWERVLELSESIGDEKHAERARRHLEHLARS